MMDEPIYLDFNATTPVAPEVFAAMTPYLTTEFGNPSSGHVYGRRARDAVERARGQVAELIGAQADEIVFTSCGTEANNLAIRGWAAALGRPAHMVTSTIEHPATEQPCRLLEAAGWQVSRAPVGPSGRLDPFEVAGLLRPDTALVSIMHANNETGILQPITEIVHETARHGITVHSDAAQSVGKLPVLVNALGVDLLSLAGHKLHAPKGIGALFVRRGTRLAPLIVGGGQERSLRPGTENVAHIVGLGAACALAQRRLAENGDRVMALRDRLWNRLASRIPGLKLTGDPRHRLPNTLNIRFPEMRGNAVLATAPTIAASTGSACHEGGEHASAVLRAMGIAEADALGAVRLSLGWTTSEAEVEAAAAALIAAWRCCTLDGGGRSG